MTKKQSWIKNVGAKLSSAKDALERRGEKRDGERFSSLDDNPFDIKNRNKRFSTYRSEIVHGVMLKPLDKFLDQEARGEGSDDGLLSGIWSFKDDEDSDDDETQDGDEEENS